ncbi:hypothetical protein X801_08100 [Opisthorchis viverrini]|uniref:Uncharacterized protein n=1 Tax=Opisthorchis viverrini TaxID=6198 RepID=A0A1S8WNL5_OPIVI|nr:hypothetical protein X801_08100 [Opisthorchis viverrini]
MNFLFLDLLDLNYSPSKIGGCMFSLTHCRSADCASLCIRTEHIQLLQLRIQGSEFLKLDAHQCLTILPIYGPGIEKSSHGFSHRENTNLYRRVVSKLFLVHNTKEGGYLVYQFHVLSTQQKC